MKNKLLLLVIAIITLKQTIAQVKFPEIFPKELINKKICGHTEVYAKDFFSGKTNYGMSTDFDYTVTISEVEGIYVEYNPGERWNDASRNGTTQKITEFVFWKKEDKYSTDKYGDITGQWSVYHYKVYYDAENISNGHYIKEFKIVTDNRGSSIKLTIAVKTHQDASISYGTNYNNIKTHICGSIKSAKELELEKEAARKEKERKDKELADLKYKENILKLNNVKAKINLGNLDDALLLFKEVDLTQPYIKDHLVELQYCKQIIEDYINSYPKLDSITTNKINEAVLLKDSTKAIKLFYDLKLENSKKQVSNSLIGIIQGSYSKSAVNLSENKQEIYRILQTVTGKNQITQITKSGIHRIYLAADGKVFIDSINTSFNVKPYQENFYGTDIARPAFFTLNISTYSTNQNEFVVEVPEGIKKEKMSPYKIFEQLYSLYNPQYSFEKVVDLGYWPKIYYMSNGNSYSSLHPLKNDIKYVKVNPSLKTNQVNIIYGKLSFLTYQSPNHQDLILNVVVDKVVLANKSKITFK